MAGEEALEPALQAAADRDEFAGVRARIRRGRGDYAGARPDLQRAIDLEDRQTLVLVAAFGVQALRRARPDLRRG